MIKIIKKLIKEIIKLDNPTDEDYRILWGFIEPRLLKAIIIKEDKLVIEALKKYNQKDEVLR
jgi:hypothetical protein